MLAHKLRAEYVVSSHVDEMVRIVGRNVPVSEAYTASLII